MLPFIRIGSPGGARLEITASPIRDVSIPDAVHCCVDPTTVWAPLRNPVHPPEVWAAVPSGETGIAGYSHRSGVIVRLVHRRGMDAVEALREAEDAAGTRVRPEIAAALLAARKAGRPVRGAEGPSLLADIAGKAPGPDRALPRLPRAEIEAMARRAVEEAASGEEAVTVPQDGVDRARFLLALGELLWRPEVRRRLRGVEMKFDAGVLLTGLAGIHMALLDEGQRAVEVSGIRLMPANLETALLWWPQVLEWDRGIPPEVLLWYCPGARFDGSRETVDRSRWSVEEVGDVDPRTCAAVASSLLTEAERSARYVPFGRFTLHLPEEIPLRRWNVEALRIAADPQGMWVGLAAEGGRVPLSFRWEPGKPITRGLVDTVVSPLVEAVLAAVWHDLRVAGEAPFPRRDRRPAERREEPPAEPRERAGKPSVRTIPSPLRVSLEGHREWGEPDERRRIVRRAHGVRGHIRLLREGWKRSPQAEQAAAAYGIVLPEGYTFVRPHVRGREKDQGEEHVPVVRAKGLATVLTLLGMGRREVPA
jgi:hypothetical protein